MDSSEYKRRWKKFADELNMKHRKFLWDVGGKWAIECLKQTPVVTGMLKASLKSKPTLEGFIISYDVPYAYGVHEGKHDRLQEQWVSPIPKHKRKTPSGKVIWVRKHTKTYKEGYKPIKGQASSGKGMGWYAKDMHEVTEGRKWMTNAYEKVLKSMSKEDKTLLPKKIKIELGT